MCERVNLEKIKHFDDRHFNTLSQTNQWNEIKYLNQIATKHTETQNYYDMFNNLGEQKKYLEKVK